MKISTTLNIFALILLSLCGAGVALTIWNARTAEQHSDRILLANNSYAQHLELSKGIYRLLNSAADEELGGALSPSYAREDLISSVRDDIKAIRGIIAAEIELVGEDEIEELELLAEMERRAEKLIEVVNAPSNVVSGPRWPAAIRALNEGGASFRELIDEALAEELEEVEKTRGAAIRQADIAGDVALTLGFVAASMTLFMVISVRRQISRPLDNLLVTIRRFGAGDFGSRAKVQGTGEIRIFGQVINEMADKVQASARIEAARRSELENAVQSRTRQLEGALSEMETVAENRKRLLADVSHELRTPLTIIRGEADIALRGGEKSPEVYREALTRSRDAAAHTSRLVDDLLFVARGEAGVARLEILENDLIAIVKSATQLTKVSFEIETPLASAPLQADGQRLTQCILILLENAARYGGETIVLRVDKNIGGYRLAVEDNGPGMSKDDRSRAFQRFFRGSNAAASYSEGVGLGLPVVKSIVDAHGGAITIDSREGGGLIVAFTVPMRARRAAA